MAGSIESTFAATAAHLDATGAPQPISAIPGVYAWTTGWTVSTEIKNTIGNIDIAGAIKAFPDAGSIPGSTVTVGVKSPNNGEGTLTATAKVTDDTINNPSTKNNTLNGTSDITVMICNDPWPARAGDHSWAPAQNST